MEIQYDGRHHIESPFSMEPWLLRYVEFYNNSNNDGEYSYSKEDDFNITNDDVSLSEDDIKSDLE